ncbi:unnamed protein product [Cuscuta epithymum]|uniref:Cellulose synthase-like protein E1 n=1 Tax=Cuscuta epithymum TaxID=186058 RepID=A0AAV0D113_9ASTE|nr:unnamed protein product [Cuscuta epithymum]
MEDDGKYEALFETKTGKGRVVYRLLASTILAGIVCVLIYRVVHMPAAEGGGMWWWVGMLAAELWFGFYWLLTQFLRWNLLFRRPFPHKLLKRYGNNLPNVDVFVCTADPKTEPPIMVVNTVLSVMAYDYPPEKLSVYLSDDAGSELTFYALLEASIFSKHWLPFCKKNNIDPRCPAAYFPLHQDGVEPTDFSMLKKRYQEMENRIMIACKLGRVPTYDLFEERGYSKWDPSSSPGNHAAMVKILIDEREEEAKDNEGHVLPTLVYMAREKRPQYFHNFKAGAMNGLIRVSSEISNAPIILNVDCDMYSNNSGSIQDALCFFMDEKKSHNIAFAQFPQNFQNITKNDLYAGSLLVTDKVEFHGLDGCGGPLYIGTGCFHRREALCGREFSKENKIELKSHSPIRTHKNACELEERLQELVSCTYEENTQWGYEIGLKYGCPVEDVLTGLSILSHGWKSAYYSPTKNAFLGVTGTTLEQALVQHKRWSEGDLQILFSKYSPVWYGLGKLNTGLIFGSLTYCLWSPNCLALLYYSIVPSLHLLKGSPLFPQVSSKWILAFAYLIVMEHAYSCSEFLWAGGTLLGWWNDQRMWLYKRSSSYLFALLDTVLKLVGYSSNHTFVISSKVSDEDVSLRYEQEIMEFGSTSPMFTVLSTLAMINLFCFVWVLKKMATEEFIFQSLALQIVLCGVLVLINLPLYNGMFFRTDHGKMPIITTLKSTIVALSVCTCFAIS